MLTDEWHFQEERRVFKKRGEKRRKGWRTSWYDEPYLMKCSTNEARANGKRRTFVCPHQQMLCPVLNSSSPDCIVTLKGYPDLPLCKYRRSWQDSQTCVGPRPWGLSWRGRWIKINRKSQTQALFNSLASLWIKIYLKVVDCKAN